MENSEQEERNKEIIARILSSLEWLRAKAEWMSQNTEDHIQDEMDSIASQINEIIENVIYLK